MSNLATPTPTAAPPAGTRLSVVEYLAAYDAGLWPDDAPELIDTTLAEPMPLPDPPHDFAVEQIVALLVALLPDGWFVRQEKSLRLSTSVVGPDVMVVRGHRRDYRERMPAAADVALVVEVAHTSQTRDRQKARIYARDGIASYLLVDLTAGTLTHHTDPTADGYATVAEVDAAPVVIDGEPVGTLAAGDILTD